MVTMLSFFWIVDLLFTAFACESILLEGPSVMILFASEVRQRRYMASPKADDLPVSHHDCQQLEHYFQVRSQCDRPSI